LIVVGAGPAGVTAAIYAARKKMSVLVLSERVGGQAVFSGEVANYPSYQVISGAELAKKFFDHLSIFPGVEYEEGEVVSLSRDADECFTVRTRNGLFRARSLVIASGARPRQLGVPGEKEFAGKGVFYCAVCDAPLMRDRVAAVVGGGNSALDAVLQLEKVARKTLLFTINSELQGDEVMKEKVLASRKISVFYSALVARIVGGKLVSGMEVLVNGRKKFFAVDGVFVEVGYEPSTGFARGFLKLNEFNEIIVDRRQAASVPGVFAAGDCTDSPAKQIIVAAGEGAVAALSAWKYLLARKEKKKR
jgi:alkyl hydroperoxide reductase subunit F